MTEEIIIDGVDVAGCEFLRNCIIPDNYGCKIDDSLCCDVGNCYYKQLKRLEQERDELKTELHSKVEFIQEQRTIINEYAKEIEIYKQCQGKRASKREDELEQENKRLKDELNKTIKEYNYFNKACVEANTKNIELQRENEILKKKLDMAVGRSTTHGEAAEKYWAVLEEIREMCNRHLDAKEICYATQVIDKIDEVLNLS